MENAAAALDRLCDPSAEVSAHYLIGNNGQVWHLVEEGMRAWHAGVGSWAGSEDINSRSIGIELDNRGTHPFSECQMSALETLMRAVMTRWQIPAKGVIGHSDMAPGRKQDPGPHFDWGRLARQGLAAQPCPASHEEVSQVNFMRSAHQAGYTASAPFEVLLSATRLRFAPWRTGPLCHCDFTFGK
jgi:N-acetylmuramoyl-L-alanine amidase